MRIMSSKNTLRKKKGLNISEPMITTYTQHAHLLSILGLNESSYSWIYSNYIQIYANKDLMSFPWADFYFPCPFELRVSDLCHLVSTQKIQRSVVSDIWSNFIDCIIYSIDNETYVHAMIDLYYVPNTASFNTFHFLHDILIYGYDCQEKKISAFDFINQGKYNNFEISFENINKGFIDYEKCSNLDYLYKNLYFYQIKSSCNYKFDFMNILNSIKAYLDGATPEYWKCYSDTNKDIKVFGINYYKALIEYVINCSRNDKELQYTFFYLLLDHKRIMTMRFNYLCQIGYNYNPYLDELNEIERVSHTILNLTIKYNVVHGSKIVERIIKYLNEVEARERQVLTNILKIEYKH